MTEKLLVPEIGDFENVEVIELLVKEGQEIKINDPVVTIESDKSSVEIPSTFSGKIESIKVKVGDKVSKGDLILSILNSNQSLSSNQSVPKNTENLIQEAENALEKNQTKKPKIEKKEKSTIQVVKEGDLDPVETNEWLESLSAVIEKDGNQRANYLIKQLINQAYMEGANIPYKKKYSLYKYNPSKRRKKVKWRSKYREKN